VAFDDGFHRFQSNGRGIIQSSGCKFLLHLLERNSDIGYPPDLGGNMKPLGDRIRVLREEMDLSQEDLAKRIGIDRVSLSQIENGKRSVKAEELGLIANALNVSADMLLGLTSPPEVRLEKGKPILPMRINVPQQNVQRFKEVLLYILSKVGAKPNVGETVLYKLLYFIDFDYYEKYEEQLIGATYQKNRFGPTPMEFQSIVKEMIAKKELDLIKSPHYKFEQKKYLPRREANLSLFTADQTHLIDEVLNKLSNMTATAISEYSHGDVPWLTTKDGEKIDYESVFYRTPPYSIRTYTSEEL
jgi:transcriptional regulator with XRE-family HTH domain